MADLKFCKECKHFAWLPDAVGYYRDACLNPKNTAEPEPVRGRVVQLREPWELRQPSGLCGSNGAWFEPGPPAAPEPAAGSIQVLPTTPVEASGWFGRLFGR